MTTRNQQDRRRNPIKGTPVEVVRACAERFARRHRLSTIGQWNALVELLAWRHSGCPQRTIDAVRIHVRAGREHRPIVITDTGWVRPKQRCFASDVQQRAERIARARDDRLARVCAHCGVESTGTGMAGVQPRPASLPQHMADGSPERPRLCLTCWNRYRPVVRRAWEQTSTRNFINRTRRQLTRMTQESTHG